MDDLISRQAAIDALERAQSLVEKPITETRWFDFGLRKAQEILSELPSADAVQVTRCKDCKHLLIVTNDPLMGLCRLSAPKTLTMWEEDIATHFCGWGERKDDE